MPNPVFPPSSISHGKVSPILNYIFDGNDGEWRPLTPADLAGANGSSFQFVPPSASGYRILNLSGKSIEVSQSASKLAGFFVDNNLNDEPLYIQFSGYGSSPVLTYPIYAQSTLDQNFSYSIDGFQGIVTQITIDKEGLYPWEGNNGIGLMANIYYRI
jgi:hypothetical protein